MFPQSILAALAQPRALAQPQALAQVP